MFELPAFLLLAWIAWDDAWKGLISDWKLYAYTGLAAIGPLAEENYLLLFTMCLVVLIFIVLDRLNLMGEADGWILAGFLGFLGYPYTGMALMLASALTLAYSLYLSRSTLNKARLKHEKHGLEAAYAYLKRSNALNRPIHFIPFLFVGGLVALALKTYLNA